MRHEAKGDENHWGGKSFQDVDRKSLPASGKVECWSYPHAGDDSITNAMLGQGQKNPVPTFIKRRAERKEGKNPRATSRKNLPFF